MEKIFFIIFYEKSENISNILINDIAQNQYYNKIMDDSIIFINEINISQYQKKEKGVIELKFDIVKNININKNNLEEDPSKEPLMQKDNNDNNDRYKYIIKIKKNIKDNILFLFNFSFINNIF